MTPEQQNNQVPFDPSQPFEVVSAGQIPFDPSKPFDVVKQKPKVPERRQSKLERTGLQFARDLTRSALSGATLGWADEIGSAVASIPASISEGQIPFVSDRGREIYREMQSGIDEEQRQFQKDHPVIATGAEIVGSLPLAATGIGSVAKGATLGQAVSTGVKAGGAAGAIYGAGTSEGNLSSMEGAKELVSDAAISGGTGAALGGALPLAGAAVKGAFRSGKDLIKQVRSTGGEKAVRAIEMQAKELGTTPEKLLAKLDELGEEASLADLDKAFRRQASAAYSKSPSVQGRIDKMLDARQSMQGQDIKREFIDSLGDTSSDNLTDALENLAKKRMDESSPLYEKGLKQIVPESDDYDKLKVMPAFQKAKKLASKYYSDDMSRVKKSSEPLLGSGYQAGRMTEAEQLHYAKQAMWDMEKNLRANAKGAAADKVKEQRQTLTKVLDSIPEYKQARQIWSDSMDMEDAAEIGADFLKNTVDADDFTRAMSRLTESQKEMAKLAALKDVVRKLEFKGDNDSMTKMLKGSEGMRKKMRALFGSEDEMQRYVKKISKWDTFQETRNLIKQGSDTQLKQEAAGSLDKMLSILGGVKTAAVDYALEKVGGESAKQANKSLARLLTSPKAARPVLEQVQKNALAAQARGGLGSRTAVRSVTPVNVMTQRAVE